MVPASFSSPAIIMGMLLLLLLLLLLLVLLLLLLLLLAPSPCKRAKSASSPEPKFTGPRSISRIFEGLEVRKVLVPSALLRFGKMQKFALVRKAAFAHPDSVSSSSAAYDIHKILRGPVSLFHAQTIIPFVFREHTVTSASMPKP